MKTDCQKWAYPFLCILLLSFCSSVPKRVIILCAGDSITEAEYPRFLQKLCQREGIRAKVLNFGRSGYSSGEYLSFLKNNRNILTAKHPDFVLLQLGTNDVRLDYDLTSSDEFYSNMKNIIKIFKEFRNQTGRKTKIFLATIPPVLKDCPFPFSSESSARVTDEINPLIKKICKEENIPLVDNYSRFIHSPHLLPEIHPSREGYKQLAQNWFSALKPLLKKYSHSY